MTTWQIPGRPFASEQITGLALPDGIFEIAFGQLTINAHIQNGGRAPVTGASVDIESVSDPGIAVVAATQPLPHLPPGGARLVRWRADFTRATPGRHRISFVIVDPSGARARIVQDIFVTRTTFDARTNTVAMETPEGVMRAGLPVVVRPVDDGCCGTPLAGSGSGSGGGLGGGGSTGTGGGGGGAAGYGPGSASRCGCACGCQRPTAATKRPLAAFRRDANPLAGILQAALGGDIQLCPTWYLPQGIGWVWEPTPPYAGQYGDLPFQTVWWKVLLCVIAVVLALAASIVSSGAIPLGAGDPSGMSAAGPGRTSCGLTAGATRSTVAAGLVAAAAACVTAAALSDARDPIRIGQTHTPPGPGELTVAERLYAELSFPEPVALGTPFTVDTRWTYTRVTTAREYPYAAHDVHQNVHVVSTSEVTAPDLNHAFRDEPWICRARFWDADGELMTGAELFVQCLLVGPCAQVIRVVMQDDAAAGGDGTYTGLHRFTREAEGLWKYLVVAQDVNTAQPDLTPEQAAQIIGGMVRTHSLTISFDGGTCRLAPDGYVQVIGGLI